MRANRRDAPTAKPARCSLEAIDPRPVEGVRSTGAGRIQEIVYGVIAQVLPLWTSFSLYRFETDVRSATGCGSSTGSEAGLVFSPAPKLIWIKPALSEKFTIGFWAISRPQCWEICLFLISVTFSAALHAGRRLPEFCMPRLAISRRRSTHYLATRMIQAHGLPSSFLRPQP